MIDLNKLNCMNYHVQNHSDDEFWYAQNGLRSLFEYSKKADISFRDICQNLDTVGEVTFAMPWGICTLTMI